MSTRYKNNIKGLHEADWLALEVAKARLALGVSSQWTLTEAVNRTMAWYRAQQDGAEARALCELEIVAYEAFV